MGFDRVISIQILADIFGTSVYTLQGTANSASLGGAYRAKYGTANSASLGGAYRAKHGETSNTIQLQASPTIFRAALMPLGTTFFKAVRDAPAYSRAVTPRKELQKACP